MLAVGVGGFSEVGDFLPSALLSSSFDFFAVGLGNSFVSLSDWLEGSNTPLIEKGFISGSSGVVLGDLVGWMSSSVFDFRFRLIGLRLVVLALTWRRVETFSCERKDWSTLTCSKYLPPWKRVDNKCQSYFKKVWIDKIKILVEN